MDFEKLALRTLARLTPEAAEKRLIQHFLEFDVCWCQDIIARPDTYRAAVQDGLPTLSPDQRQYLEAVWADIENRLARGESELFKNPTPDEPGLSATPPDVIECLIILMSPFCEADSDAELLQLQITAGWCAPNPPHVELIDISQRLDELLAGYE